VSDGTHASDKILGAYTSLAGFYALLYGSNQSSAEWQEYNNRSFASNLVVFLVSPFLVGLSDGQ